MWNTFGDRRRAMLRSVATLGLIGAGILSVVPASAEGLTADQCANLAGDVAVEAVAISAGQTIRLQQGAGGQYIGEGQTLAYCRRKSDFANVGDIANAKVKIGVRANGFSASDFSITGVGVPSANVVPPSMTDCMDGPCLVESEIGPFTGRATFRIAAASTILPWGVVSQPVGVQIEFVSAAYGDPLTDPSGVPLQPGTFGKLIAQTPELDSLVLFGTGALGLISYAQLRRRSRRNA